ncbi:MAG: DUF2062 domain-containing protein [Campylobacterota bacterium]|nr:DUF2062 domain-containing protein [Campylobacterota bacterium]
MIRRQLKKTTKSKKLNAILEKYKVSAEYTSGSRKMISRGVFIGLFIAFIPMPLQMLLVVSLTFFGKFNVPIALAMVFVSNPLTMPFIYYMEYLTGSFILGVESISVEITLEWFTKNFDNIVIPLYVGSFFYSIVCSFLGYYLVNYFWKTSVHKERSKSNTKSSYK